MRPTFILRHLPIGLIFCVGIGLSMMAAVWIEKWEINNRQIRFQKQTENLTTALERSLNRYTEVLQSMGDFYAVGGLGVSRQQFARFVQRSHSSYPGIQALEWSPRVLHSQRFAYEKRLQKEGFNNFQITELSLGELVRAGDRLEYFPVTYVEPLADNKAAIGYDLASNPIRRAALETARNTKAITATGRIRLVQDKRNQYGFLVFLPLYPQAIPSQREQLAGYLLGVFRVSDVVEESLQNLRYDIDFALYDRSANSTEQFLGFYQAATQRVAIAPEEPAKAIEQRLQQQAMAKSLCQSDTECLHTLALGGRQWAIVFSPASQYPSHNSYSAIATLMTGFLLTSSLTLFLITMRRKLTRTQELSDLKLRFFSLASHELRTPLSTILLSAQSLEMNGSELSAEQQYKNLQRIQTAAKRMNQLISDILTLTKAEVGKLEVTPERFNLSSFCQQLVEEMQVGTTHRICLSDRFQGNYVYLDQKLLRSLLTNLLSNAIKYSPDPQPIEFELSGDSREIIFRVRDRGIGIPLEDREKIYETFYRGKNVGEVAGTGLGLSIVKTCVDIFQGNIAIDSNLEGTTVTVQIQNL